MLLAPLDLLGDLRSVTIGLRGFDENAARMAVARLRDAAEPAPVTARILTRREPEIAHELTRIVEAGQVAELGDRGDRHRELHAAECLQGFDDRIEAPRLRLLEQLGLQALQQLRAFRDCA